MQSAPQELLKQYVQSQHLLSYGGRRQDFSIVWSDQANTGQTGGPFQVNSGPRGTRSPGGAACRRLQRGGFTTGDLNMKRAERWELVSGKSVV